MKTKFIGTWDKKWQQLYDVPRGFLIIKPKEIYFSNIGKCLNAVDKQQIKKEELKELDITLEFHYRKRTLDQNSLMWALYTVEANEMNAGLKGDKSQMVTPQELYDTDNLEYSERIQIKVSKNMLNAVKSEYRIIDEKPVGDQFVLTAITTTSMYNTKQMNERIDMQFNRMACNGVTVTNPGEIHNYWVQWRQNLNDNKLILHDDVLTGSQYKALNPICEATGDYIGDGAGQLAHIKAKGQGGDISKEKDYASNWLHLSTKAHIEIQHQKGWEEFLRRHPHLKYKVETALRREYKDLGGNE